MRYLAYQTKKDYPGIFRKLQYDGIINDRAKLEQQIQAQVTDYSRTFVSASTILDVLLDDPHKNVLFPESDFLLRPPNKMSADVYQTGKRQALPNGGSLYLINTVVAATDHAMMLGTRCPCPGIDNHKSAVQEGVEVEKSVDFSFIKPLIKAFKLELVYEQNYNLLNCYKIALFLKASYYSDPQFKTSDYKDIWGDGKEMWTKLTECYNAGSVMLQGKNLMLRTSATPLMEKFIVALEERIEFEKSKKEKQSSSNVKDRLAQIYNLYVGHGTNMQSVLTLLNNFDRDCIIENFKKRKPIKDFCRLLPKSSSSLNFELYPPAEGQSEFRIRVRLNDEYLKIDQTSDDTIHTFSQFKSIIGKNLVQNWKEVCKISNASKEEIKQKQDTKTLYFVFFICTIDFGLLALISTILAKSYANRKKVKSIEELKLSNLENYGSHSTMRKSMTHLDTTFTETFSAQTGSEQVPSSFMNDTNNSLTLSFNLNSFSPNKKRKSSQSKKKRLKSKGRTDEGMGGVASNCIIQKQQQEREDSINSNKGFYGKRLDDILSGGVRKKSYTQFSDDE